MSPTSWRVAVSGVCAIAALPSAAVAAPMRYDCDTTAGAYSEIAQTQTGPNYSLRADITAKHLGKHPKWRPGATIQIESADGRNVIGVRLAAGSYRSETLSVTLFNRRDEEGKEYNVTTIRVGEAVPASIRVKGGVVRAEVAGQVAELPLPLGTSAQVRVTCSTGQFIFEKLEMASNE